MANRKSAARFLKLFNDLAGLDVPALFLLELHISIDLLQCGRPTGWDMFIVWENFRFYFPVATCVLLSLLLTAIMWIVRHLSR